MGTLVRLVFRVSSPEPVVLTFGAHSTVFVSNCVVGGGDGVLLEGDECNTVLSQVEVCNSDVYGVTVSDTVSSNVTVC